MRIQLNGRPREVVEGISVGRLLEELKIHPSRVAVQVNLDILKRDQLEAVTLRTGDEVEVLTIMSGG